MRMAMGTLALATLVLFGCSPEQRQINEAKEQFRSEARDPGSLRFRNMRFVEKSGAVCGEVNGRNGFGGQTGWLPILVRDGRAEVATERLEDEDPKIAGFWDRYMCACYTEEERVARTDLYFTCSSS